MTLKHSIKKSRRRRSKRVSTPIKKSRRRRSKRVSTPIKKSRRRRSKRVSRKSVKKSSNKNKPMFGFNMKNRSTFKFDTKNQNNFYVNNIDYTDIKNIDIWMVRFILRVNKIYTYGLLSPENLKISEKFINAYKDYLVDGEKNVNGMIKKMNMYTSQLMGNRIKFGMVATKRQNVSENVQTPLSKLTNEMSEYMVDFKTDNISEFTESITADDEIDKRFKNLISVKEYDLSNEERLKSLLTDTENATFERKNEIYEVLNNIGVIDSNKTSESIIETQQKMAQSLQDILSQQTQTLSVVNNINTSVNSMVTKRTTIRNIISATCIKTIKTSLKVAYSGSVGMPWYIFKTGINFSIAGGKILFNPFIILIYISCFLITMGNTCYVLTIPVEDILVPNKYSAIIEKYPNIETKTDRFSLVDQFKNNVVKTTDIIDVNYLDYKHHTEGYKILKNLSRYKRIYHNSGKIPKMIMDEYSIAEKLGKYYYFRGYHIVIDLFTNLERPTEGYKRIVQEISGASEIKEWYDTSAYKTQKAAWDLCKEKFGNYSGHYICGKEPVMSADYINKKDAEQKEYLKWKECEDYNAKLNKATSFIWKKNCGPMPKKYEPAQEFIIKHKQTIGGFILKKLLYWFDEKEITKNLN